MVIVLLLMYKGWGLHMSREDHVNFSQKGDQRYYIAKGLQEGNVLGFGRAKSNLSLKSTNPMNRAVCIHDDIAGA